MPPTRTTSPEPNCPPGHKEIAGHFDPLSQKVDLASGQVVDYIPPQPSPDHEWNANSKRWNLSVAAMAKITARAAAAARIATLVDSQHTWIRKHALGDPAAIQHLREIDDEIAVLSQ